MAVFTAEYALRLWSGPAGGWRGLRGRLRLAARPLLVIDLLAILPAYLTFLGVDLRVLRMARMVRLARLAKLARYSVALRLLGRGLWERREELVVTALVGVFALFVAAALMYYAEHDAQPEVFASIPASFWWAVTTLTTVGYGDAYPVTVAGKVVGALVQVLGVGLFAVPAGLLGGSFLEQVERRRREREPPRCPHCGAALPPGHEP